MAGLKKMLNITYYSILSTLIRISFYGENAIIFIC